MDVCCQDIFDTKWKRIDLKEKLNLLDNNEYNAIALMLYGKELATSCPSEKNHEKN